MVEYGVDSAKEKVYKALQAPDRENFFELITNGFGEQDNLDFKEVWIDAQKLASIILGIANTGGGIVILGVRENGNGTLAPIGLEELEDKEKMIGKLANFLPENLKPNILDFDFRDEAYSKVEGKLFQRMCIYSNDIELPYVWKKNSNEAEGGCIFYRRGTSTVKANVQEIKDMINKRIEAAYAKKSSLNLEEHLIQLRTLYDYIPLYGSMTVPFANIIKNLPYLNVGQSTLKNMDNRNVPKESYEEFIVNMIEEKKEKIKKVLDLK